MPTEYNQDSFDFGTVGRRRVVSAFDGGSITSNASALHLGAADKAVKPVGRLAAVFDDRRDSDRIEHSVGTLVGPRIFGIALGYEDLNDHARLRHDPTLAVLADKAECQPQGLRSGRRQVDTQPAGAVAGRHRLLLLQDRPRRRGYCAILRDDLHRVAEEAPQAPRARHRRHA